MNYNKLIYFALGAFALLTSCSQDEPAKRDIPGENRIYFRSYLPTVTQSRAQVAGSDNFTTCQVTSFNADDPTLLDPTTGEFKSYFSDIKFEKDSEGRFMPVGGNDCLWPDPDSRLHFFAYYPSTDRMKETSDEDHFNLVNSSRLIDGNPVFDFRLNKFRVATDIADQFDFLTAYSSGTLAENANTGIQLNFKHHLARVEIAAWGANEKYDFEIAGVRIGNPLVEGDFNFSALPAANSVPWLNTGHQEPVEHIFTPGESIVSLSKNGETTTADGAVSIMGTAGPAMVIPMQSRIENWEGKGYPATDKLYFSVLLRVKNNDNKVVYPYPNDRDNMTVIYFVVDQDGTIKERVYKIDDAYYTAPDEGEGIRYLPSETEEICGFGWASLPVAAKWETGKIYTYKLNYSTGIGWHDPEDPNPGEPIIERGTVPFDVNVEEWVPANDYNPDITVPKR